MRGRDLGRFLPEDFSRLAIQTKYFKPLLDLRSGVASGSSAASPFALAGRRCLSRRAGVGVGAAGQVCRLGSQW